MFLSQELRRDWLVPVVYFLDFPSTRLPDFPLGGWEILPKPYGDFFYPSVSFSKLIWINSWVKKWCTNETIFTAYKEIKAVVLKWKKLYSYIRLALGVEASTFYNINNSMWGRGGGGGSPKDQCRFMNNWAYLYWPTHLPVILFLLKVGGEKC